MSERPSFPGRTAYLFLGVPAALLATTLLTARITPALQTMLQRGWNENVASHEAALLVACVLAVVGALVMSSLRARRLGWGMAPLWGLLSCVPILGVGVALWMGATADEDEGDGVWRLAGRLAVPAFIGWLAVAAMSWGGIYLWQEHTPMESRGQGSAYLIFSAVILTPLTTGFVAGLISARDGRSPGHSVGAAICTLAAVMTCSASRRWRACSASSWPRCRPCCSA